MNHDRCNSLQKRTPNLRRELEDKSMIHTAFSVSSAWKRSGQGDGSSGVVQERRIDDRPRGDPELVVRRRLQRSACGDAHRGAAEVGVHFAGGGGYTWRGGTRGHLKFSKRRYAAHKYAGGTGTVQQPQNFLKRHGAAR